MDSEQTNENRPPEEAGSPQPSGNEPVVNQELEEPVDNRERSRLGRKTSELEKMIQEQNDRFSRIEQMLLEREQSYSRREPPDELSDPERLLTVADLEKITQRKAAQQADMRKRYEMGYIRGIKSQYNSKDSVMYAEIENELLTNVTEYPTHTNYADPIRDAAINFRLAKANVLEKKYLDSQPKPNVKGGTNPPTGFTSSTRSDAPSKPVPKLDEFASKFAHAMNLDDDFVRKSLND